MKQVDCKHPFFFLFCSPCLILVHGPWWSMHGGSWWSMVVYGGLWWSMHGAVHGGPLWSMHGAVHGGPCIWSMLTYAWGGAWCADFSTSSVIASRSLRVERSVCRFTFCINFHPYQLLSINITLNNSCNLHLMLSAPQRTVLGVSPVFLLLTALK